MKLTKRRRRSALFSTWVAVLAGSLVMVPQGATASGQPVQKPTVPSITAAPGAPNSGPNASATSVTFTALLNPNGSVTSYCFDYGLTAKYDKVRDGSDPAWMDGETSPQFTPATTIAIKVTGYAFGLHPNTVYHYQIEAFSPYGETYSKDKTFKTK